MLSVWQETSVIPHFKSLDKNFNTDVLIIGGGLSGILCAYMLSLSGVDYALVEAETLCSGITKNTTAKITSQHGLIYDKLIKEFGQTKAKQYLQANNNAIEKFIQLSNKIDCDLKIKDSYVYSLNNKSKLEKEITALNKLGYSADLVSSVPLPFSVDGAVKFKNQAEFNPLKFVSGICKDLNIYERTPVRELIGTTAITDYGRITAKKIIVATHFPFINKHGSYYIKMYQHRSYVIALQNAVNVNGMYVDEAQCGMSFRNYKDLLLIGGGDHRTGKNGGNWQELREFAKKHYPEAKEVGHWATQDCMTLDSVAYIGQYSSKTPDLYVSTGFNKWGMTTSMVSAMILSDLVQGKDNEYASVFSPQRTILRPQLICNASQAIVSLLTPTTKRCPHLGCALKWNPYEHTWDCPCHGSRFSKVGKLIDNPATDDINIH